MASIGPATFPSAGPLILVLVVGVVGCYLRRLTVLTALA